MCSTHVMLRYIILSFQNLMEKGLWLELYYKMNLIIEI